MLIMLVIVVHPLDIGASAEDSQDLASGYVVSLVETDLFIPGIQRPEFSVAWN